MTIADDKPAAAPKKRRRTQKERTAASDAAMFAAATTLLLEYGTQETTLKHIGEKAGYSRGMAGYRFGTKENLLRELLLKNQREWAKTISAATAGKRGLDAFLASVETWEEYMFRNTDEYRAAQMLRFERVGAGKEAQLSLQSVLVMQQESIQRWLDEGIEDGDIDPDTDTRQVALRHCSIMFGTMYQLLVTPDAIEKDVFVNDYIEAFKTLYGTKRA